MKKPTCDLPCHLGNKFTWDKTHGVAEASDLGPKWKSRVWNDACDEGFVVVSHKTGKAVVFVQMLVEEKDGDIVSWTFIADQDELSIVVYND